MEDGERFQPVSSASTERVLMRLHLNLLHQRPASTFSEDLVGRTWPIITAQRSDGHCTHSMP
jgi:hypothetical protein